MSESVLKHGAHATIQTKGAVSSDHVQNFIAGKIAHITNNGSDILGATSA